MTTTLSIALGKYPHVAALRDGSVTPEGYELDFVEFSGPIPGIFRRMTRDLEFDVSEMAITTYLTAHEYHKAFTAIPIFVVREFPHRAIVVNEHAGITNPKDLEGQRVGVRAYTVTTGVWARGILADQYGVDLDSITWVIADEEHVKEFEQPKNVEYIPDADLAAMLSAGEIPAGIGVTRGEAENVKPLLTDRAEKEKAWAARGIYPINHTVVIANRVLEAHPDAARAITQAFFAAKEPFTARLASGAELSDEEKALAGRRDLVGPDPVPYGIEANRATLEAIVTFAHDQHILSTAEPIETYFAEGTEG